MSYMELLGHIRFEKGDYRKHGTIAKYAIGECRCTKCVDRWESWNPKDAVDRNRQNIRQLIPSRRSSRKS